jgi:hypothetical protein
MLRFIDECPIVEATITVDDGADARGTDAEHSTAELGSTPRNPEQFGHSPAERGNESSLARHEEAPSPTMA